MNSIYEQMNKIDDKESLNEKYNVRTPKDVKNLPESTDSHETTQFPEATWTIEVDGDILATDYDDEEEAREAFLEWCQEEGLEADDVECYIYQDFRSLDKNALASYLADKFEDTYRHQYQYYKKFKEDIERFILDNYRFPKYQHNDIEVASYDIAYNMTEILEERTGH